jgi:multiple sugar transport system permease protein
MSKLKWNLKNGNLLSLLVLLVGVVVILAPLVVVFLTSLGGEGTTAGMAINNWTLANYHQAWEQGKFLLAFANSTLVAIAVTAFQIFTSALAGYALARIKFRGRQAVTFSGGSNFSHSFSVASNSHLFGTQVGTSD